MRAILFIFVLALFGVPAMAGDRDPKLDAGIEAYDFFCSKCHGKDMVNPGTSSFDLRKFPRDQKERFYNSVSKGKGDMPAWGDVIYPEELDALWVYVSTRGGKEPVPEAKHSSLSVDPGTLVADGHLTACLARNAGVISGRRAEGGVGFDYRVSETLAKALGLDLSVVWYESEQDEESDPVRETYAMLSAGLCDMVSSHPLYANAVGTPPAKTAALPRWFGMPTEYDPSSKGLIAKRLPFVPLKPVAVTRPYMRAEIGLVYRHGDAEPAGLKDLGSRRLALQQGTLSGAMVLVEAPAVGAKAVTLNPGPNFLWQVENGAGDAAIVDVVAFDNFKRFNPTTGLRLAKWRHRIGLDIGIAVLADNDTLRLALDQSLKGLQQEGTLGAYASEEGLSYAKPHFDGLQGTYTMRTLSGVY